MLSNIHLGNSQLSNYRVGIGIPHTVHGILLIGGEATLGNNSSHWCRPPNLNLIFTFTVNQPVVAAKSPAVSTPQPSSSNKAAPAKSHGGLGAGGMADTRDPDVYVDEDPRKSISAAPSFEEYMKARK
jgi:hypothetical protein